MADRKKIIFRIEGTDENNGYLDLSVFQEKIQQFLEFLKSSAKDSGEDGAAFRVTNISHSSPFAVECEVIGKNNLPSNSAFYCIEKNLSSVETGEPSKLSYSTFSAIEKITQHDLNEFRRSEIETIGSDKERVAYYLDEKFRKKLGERQNSEKTCVSTIRGKLEQINIHNDRNIFKIYTFRKPVTCKFKNNLLSQVQDALGSSVSVRGKCFYHPNTTFPYKIDVQNMKVLLSSEDAPSLFDICGIAPSLPGEKSSEEFVRDLRDKWDKDI